MKENKILFNIASALYSVFGDYDKKLYIHRIVIKKTFFKKKIKEIIIHTSRPGIIIGRGGQSIDKLKDCLKKDFGYEVNITLKEYEPLPIISNYSFWWE